MENNELQKIWKSMDAEFDQRSKEELNLLLTAKAKQTMNRIVMIIIISVFVSTGLIVWLVLTSLNRNDDIVYLMNNVMIGIITIIALHSGIKSWYKLQHQKFNQPLKFWLEEKIKYLSKDAKRGFKNLHIFLLPFLCILITLSIHVYYEYKPFLEVLQTEESVVGLIVGILIGIFVAFYAGRKIRKYSLNNLEFLKDMYGRLCHIR